MQTSDFIKQSKTESLLVNLNRLYTFWKLYSSVGKYITGSPKVVFQLGRKEYSEFTSISHSGKSNYSYYEYYKDILDKFNAEVEQVDKDSYIWIREKL